MKRKNIFKNTSIATHIQHFCKKKILILILSLPKSSSASV